MILIYQEDFLSYQSHTIDPCKYSGGNSPKITHTNTIMKVKYSVLLYAGAYLVTQKLYTVKEPSEIPAVIKFATFSARKYNFIK